MRRYARMGVRRASCSYGVLVRSTRTECCYIVVSYWYKKVLRTEQEGENPWRRRKKKAIRSKTTPLSSCGEGMVDGIARIGPALGWLLGRALPLCCCQQAVHLIRARQERFRDWILAPASWRSVLLASACHEEGAYQPDTSVSLSFSLGTLAPASYSVGSTASTSWATLESSRPLLLFLPLVRKFTHQQLPPFPFLLCGSTILLLFSTYE